MTDQQAEGRAAKILNALEQRIADLAAEAKIGEQSTEILGAVYYVLKVEPRDGKEILEAVKVLRQRIADLEQQRNNFERDALMYEASAKARVKEVADLEAQLHKAEEEREYEADRADLMVNKAEEHLARAEAAEADNKTLAEALAEITEPYIAMSRTYPQIEKGFAALAAHAARLEAEKP